MNKAFLALAAGAMLATGCASLAPAPGEQIATLPVVNMGDTPPAGTEYVIHIPANTPIPVKLNTHGSLVGNGKSIIGSTSFTRDIYLYKYWSSYDRQHWENSHRLLNVSFGGGMDVSGLNVDIGLDQNQ